jgi:hypothetical protein
MRLPPNGLRYRRLGRTRLGNGKLPKLRNNSKKRAESQPSGARFVGQILYQPEPETSKMLQTIQDQPSDLQDLFSSFFTDS